MELSKEKLLWMYQKMVEIRKFDLKVDELFKKNMIWGTCHLYVGEEATAVGTCAALESDDYITSTHRGHGHCIAKGADIKRMMAELLGKETGYCKGRGGSMHIVDVSTGNLGANGIVGAGIPIATGAALASKRRKDGKVTVCFFGDGAVNVGPFHESLNMASIWKLPVVYVCENNQYAMSTSVQKATAVRDIAVRGQSYDMPGVVVDGNDVIAVFETVSEAVSRARRGDGPTLVESKTYRFFGHSKSDPRVYRSREEEQMWMAKDPIPRLANLLKEKGMATEEELKSIDELVDKEMEEALEFALNSPLPKLEEIAKYVYA
ncbi:MAG TPA: pyruvate dehydrogenase (acetyl-transferring) E1 component subunit alpha [Thermosynergistes sp.]|nr:pyruvate dehydrogenase (acetyl-transferring) E1 component subunit alpha [Thermosynergistes sp.]HOK19635.1 pyruvate dehydrogenase (acetyl-transferring) E1 component subunit alpha [Thermosynergistes sp.]HPU77182.1 pyruvate dehydrogenase (acetyl-transferring) E1 component subunit alpha [Thermosynergistes sp.]HPZ75761.1 pyruvate dehydrogenase (acetyl-transferring) E1 component subunit alpha [Thermosynergistes sp.]HQE20665.1 pyruvate dehydrogenase (acetyl-transferring) E1 component subunit alpha 